jgi:hypothetical protein
MAGGADDNGRDEQGMDHHLFTVWMLMACSACENLLKLDGRIADHGDKGAGPLFEKFTRCNLVPPFAAANAPSHLRCWPKHPNGRRKRNVRTERKGGIDLCRTKHFAFDIGLADADQQHNWRLVLPSSITKRAIRRRLSHQVSNERGTFGFGATRIWRRGWEDETRKASRPQMRSIFLSWMRRTARPSSRTIFSDRFNAFWPLIGNPTVVGQISIGEILVLGAAWLSVNRARTDESGSPTREQPLWPKNMVCITQHPRVRPKSVFVR